jgi:hypothetical protein
MLILQKMHWMGRSYRPLTLLSLGSWLLDNMHKKLVIDSREKINIDVHLAPFVIKS